MLRPEGWEETPPTDSQHLPQVHFPAGRGAEDAGGLFWVLDEEVRVEGSSDSVVLECLRAAFEKKEAEADGKEAGGGDGGESCLVGVCLYQQGEAPPSLLGNHNAWGCFRRLQACANVY